MQKESNISSRQRVMDLSEDPAYRRFIVAYLLNCLEERFWPSLVEEALAYVERVKEQQEAREGLAAALQEERWR